jgi:cystathionine beta-synthase
MIDTGPEIYRQMDGKLDAVVVGVGSSGTVTGLGKYFHEVLPDLEMIVADPVGSILADTINTGKTPKASSWLVHAPDLRYQPG